MRELTVALLVILCPLTSHVVAEETAAADQKSTAKTARQSVVLVIAVGSGTGTGFIVGDERWVVTNHHVIEGTSQVLIRAHNDSLYRVTQVIASSTEKDIAVLDVDFTQHVLPTLSLRNSFPAELENVIVIGHPRADVMGLAPSITTGTISAVRPDFHVPGEYGPADAIQIQAPISPGSSGSPVISIDGGDVVGIVVGSVTEAQNINIATASTEISTLIEGRGDPLALETVPPQADEIPINRSAIPLDEREAARAGVTEMHTVDVSDLATDQRTAITEIFQAASQDIFRFRWGTCSQPINHEDLNLMAPSSSNPQRWFRWPCWDEGNGAPVGPGEFYTVWFADRRETLYTSRDGVVKYWFAEETPPTGLAIRDTP